MTIQERNQELIDLLDAYGIHNEMKAKEIVKSVDKIYEKYNSEVDTSKELPY